MQTYKELYIGGEWVAPDGSEVIEVISPATEEVIGQVPHASTGDADRAVAAARKAFDDGPWPHMTPVERAEAIGRAVGRAPGPRAGHRRHHLLGERLAEAVVDHGPGVLGDDGARLLRRTSPPSTSGSTRAPA